MFVILLEAGAALNVKTTPAQARAASTNNLLFEVAGTATSTIPASSVLQVVFPAGYVLADGPVTCSLGLWPVSPAPTPSCNMASLVLTASGLFPAQFTGLIYGSLTINSIQSPSFASTQTLTIRLASGGTVLDSQTIQLTYYSQPLQCTLTPTSTIVSATTVLTVAVTPSSTLPAAGTVRVTYPSSWSSDTTQSPLSASQTVACTGLGGLAASPPCTNSNRVVTITGLSSSAITGAFSFTISPLKGPPTTSLNGQFQVELLDSSSRTMDSGGCSITTATPASLTAISVTPSSQIVSALTNWQLTFTSASVYKDSDVIMLTLPSGFGTGRVSSVMFTSANQVYWTTANTISWFVKASADIAAGSALTFTLNGLTNPPSVVSSLTASIIVSRTTGQLDTGSLPIYTLQQGTLTVDASISETGVGLDSTLTLKFSLPVGADNLQVNLPSFSYRGCSSPSLEALAWTCSFASPVLSITNVALSLAYSPSLTAVLSLTNPTSIGSFTVTLTTRSGSNPMSTGTAAVTIGARTLPHKSLTLALSNPTAQATSNFTFTVNLPVAQPPGRVVVTFPAAVTLPSTPACTIAGTAAACSTSAQTISVTIATALTAGSTVIVVGEATLPQNLQPIATSVQFYDAANALVQSGNVPPVAATNVGAFGTATLSAAGNSVYSSTTLTFTLALPASASSNPWRITISGISTYSSCSGSSALANLECGFLRGLLYVDFTLTLPFAAGTSFALTLAITNGAAAVSYQV
jgi:hypothetical protein